MASGAHADEWSHRSKLSFNTTADGVEIKEQVAELPLLIRLHSGNFAFADAKPDGGDLRVFAADGKTPLKFHVENFDAANELANLWVALPKLSPNAKTDAIVLAWGNGGAAAAVDEKGSYDARHLFVYHLADKDLVTDSSPSGNTGRASGLNAVMDGPIGAAVSLDGSARIDVPASANLRIAATDGFTFTAWIRPPAGASGMLYEQGGNALGIGLDAGSPYVRSAGGTVRANGALKPGVWQHIVVAAGGGKVKFYVDGMAAGGGDLRLGDASGPATIGQGLHADLDEVTLSNVQRSEAYIAALSSSQTADTLLTSFAEGEDSGGGASYVSILLGAVTLDGWVIIGLLGVMMVISIFVMVTKTRLLLTTAKANAVFLDAFADRSAELLTPGHAEPMKLAEDARLEQSSIYQLYLVGYQEMMHRYDKIQSEGRSWALSGPALDSIRASLDAAMVRVGQKLNSGMVLLTIAIAGGPFLGLLGTVVGVMITFAAIAAAGDVNVNSIAPGIAAALVATVAGLGVAIPALFGYNWLASKIKNTSADTQVFVDEFLTKSAELHSL